MIFDSEFAKLDLRRSSEFQKQHLVHSANIPWDELDLRLNELPSRGVGLNLICTDMIEAELAVKFLTEKKYIIKQVVNQDELHAFLANNALQLETGRQVIQLWSPSNLILEFIKLNPELTKSATVLDIGCGGGRDAVFLSMQGFEVTAIEQKQQVISRAKSLAKNNQQQIEWLTCDVNQTDCLPNKQFNIVVIIRYLNRDLIAWIKKHTPLGTFLVFQAFSEGVQTLGSPKNPKHIVQEHEFAENFGKSAGFEIIVDRIDELKDGRPVSSFIAQKTEEQQ